MKIPSLVELGLIATLSGCPKADTNIANGLKPVVGVNVVNVSDDETDTSIKGLLSPTDESYGPSDQEFSAVADLFKEMANCAMEYSGQDFETFIVRPPTSPNDGNGIATPISFCEIFEYDRFGLREPPEFAGIYDFDEIRACVARAVKKSDISFIHIEDESWSSLQGESVTYGFKAPLKSRTVARIDVDPKKFSACSQSQE